MSHIHHREQGKGQEDETRDREVAARTGTKETHKGYKMFSSHEIDQVTEVGAVAEEGEEKH